MRLGELNATVPYDFMGPIQPGDERGPAPLTVGIESIFDEWLATPSVTPQPQPMVVQSPAAQKAPSKASVVYQQPMPLLSPTPSPVAQSFVADAQSSVAVADAGTVAGVSMSGIPWKTILIIGGAALVGWWLIKRSRKGRR